MFFEIAGVITFKDGSTDIVSRYHQKPDGMWVFELFDGSVCYWKKRSSACELGEFAFYDLKDEYTFVVNDKVESVEIHKTNDGNIWKWQTSGFSKS